MCPGDSGDEAAARERRAGAIKVRADSRIGDSGAKVEGRGGTEQRPAELKEAEMSRKKWIRDDKVLKCPECGRFMSRSEDGEWWACENCDWLVMAGGTAGRD